MQKYRILSMLILAAILLLNCINTPTQSATIMGYNASALSSNDIYKENEPINRVFHVKTGSTHASRKIRFEQIAGCIEYYMCKPTTKSCMQKYKILIFNNETKKAEKTYNWSWTKGVTITLDKKNCNYTIIVYPEDFDVVLNKYLTTKILKLRPIIYGYKKSPYFTVCTSASIQYSESDSIKAAPF